MRAEPCQCIFPRSHARKAEITVRTRSGSGHRPVLRGRLCMSSVVFVVLAGVITGEDVAQAHRRRLTTPPSPASLRVAVACLCMHEPIGTWIALEIMHGPISARCMSHRSGTPGLQTAEWLGMCALASSPGRTLLLWGRSTTGMLTTAPGMGACLRAAGPLTGHPRCSPAWFSRIACTE